MSDRTSDSQMARLFVALELPVPVRAAIAAWGAEELRDPALRVVAEENLHITLVFLGPTPVGKIERIAAAVLGARGEAPPVEFLPDLVVLPRGRAPGLYAIGVRSAGAEQIEARLASALEAAGVYEPGGRPFRPHVTVARVKRMRGERRKTMRVESPPGRLPQTLLQPFRAVRLALYLSSFGPDGVRYSPLAQVELHSGEAAVR